MKSISKVWEMVVKINSEIIAKMCAKQVPEEWELSAARQALLDATFIQSFPVTEKYGDVQPNVWASIQPAYIKAGKFSNEMGPATFLNGNLIAAANEFDEAQTKEDSEAWDAANP